MSRINLAFNGMVLVALLGPLAFLRLEAQGKGIVSAGRDDQLNPVLVELFTSEGCSDCPPADALLEKLDRYQPIRDAQLIVLSEHVDYWDDIGWRDPYSSHAFSERQNAFAGHFGLATVYTPQMVVDGSIQLVGSDERAAIRAIERVARAAKIPVNLSSARFEGGKVVAVHIEVGALLPAVSDESANVLLALADDSDESNVSRGENAGRKLKHVAVVRDLVLVGTVNKASGLSKDMKVGLSEGHSQNLRLVAFVQEWTDGRILGAGSARLPN
jgi:hypothetical protein